MDEYQYAIMKKTLERIQERVTVWRNVTEKAENGEECSYDTPEEVSDDMMHDIETALEEAGFHE